MHMKLDCNEWRCRKVRYGQAGTAIVVEPAKTFEPLIFVGYSVF